MEEDKRLQKARMLLEANRVDVSTLTDEEILAKGEDDTEINWLYLITPGYKRGEDEDMLAYLDRIEPLVKANTIRSKITNAQALRIAAEHKLGRLMPEGIYTSFNRPDIGECEDEYESHQLQPRGFLQERGWWRD